MGYAQARRHERKRCTMILLLTAGIMGITLFVLAKAAKHFGLPIKGKALPLAPLRPNPGPPRPGRVD